MAEAAPTLWQRLWCMRLHDAVRGRWDASLHWQVVLANSDLPEELQRVVQDTVRATRLWRGEKVDVTRELVAHFQDGLDRGLSAPALVATFGDPTQTAALIRRAKKRGRPLVGRVWHYGWIVFVAIGLLYIFYCICLKTPRPVISTDYLAIINERAVSVPEAERAWPVASTLRSIRCNHPIRMRTKVTG